MSFKLKILITIAIIVAVAVFVSSVVMIGCNNAEVDAGATNDVATEKVEDEVVENTEPTEVVVVIVIVGEEMEKPTETEPTEEVKPTEKVEEPTKPKEEPKRETTEETKEETKPEKPKQENPEGNLVSLGKFKLTAYCNCKKCCGKWAGGATASGVMPKENRTIAVDTKVIPFGTKIVINGKTYVAEDTGSAIKGNKIDIYMSSHSKALQWGVQYAEVFKVVK